MRANNGAIRSDLAAHDYVVSLPIREVVRELVQLLGSTTVAAIGGVKDMLTSRANREFTQAWFHAANPRIDDRIPMLLLRDLPLEQIQRPLLNAARAFVTRNDEATA